MRRLVYSPKVYAFVRTDGTANSTTPYLDISDYIVRGNVTRLVGSASTLTLTLRNPNKVFTGNNAGHAPTFHPMDPITVYMSRYEDYPVQVFTGYLDKTPYLQLFPERFSLKASCTLKRLLHTYWDPALPFTREFMNKFGWYQDQNTGQMQNVASQATTVNNQGKLTDGSISQVLYAVLTEPRLGNWNTNEVFIEQLPPDLIQRIKDIYTRFAEDQHALEAQLTTLLTQIVGTGSQGTGGGNPNASTSGSTSAGGQYDKAQLEALWIQAGGNPVKADIASAIALAESSGDPNQVNSIGCVGLWQVYAKVHPEYPGDLKDPLYNAKAAVGISGNGTNWNPWTTYTGADTGPNGGPGPKTYLKFLNAATVPKPKGGDVVSGFLGGSAASKDSSINPPKGTGKTAGGAPETRLAAINQAAKDINDKRLTYTWGGGHNATFSPSPGYDCSGSVSAVLHAAGYIDRSMTSGELASFGDPGPGRVTIYANADHVFMSIDGVFWGTSDGHGGNPNQPSGKGPGFLPDPPSKAYLDGFTKRHPPDLGGDPKISYGNGTGAGGGGEGPGNSGTTLSNSTATAFANQVSWPSIEESSEAILLQGDKSLMNDKQIFPFIQELTSAALRQFQSLPNGDFFAFFPDYFGDFGHRKAYWKIDDIEILDGKIELTDDALATHVYIVGDTGVPLDGVNFVDKILSGGVVNIFNAFESGFVMGEDAKPLSSFDPRHPPKKLLAERADAVKFLQKYGARPYYEEVPAIRSPYYEAFYAFQTFQLLWSRTFLTEFQFTFMPEVYPGGIVAFPDHNLQCYVDSVSHDFDYEAGFTTTAQLSAPAYYDPTGKGRDPLGLSTGLIRANPKL